MTVTLSKTTKMPCKSWSLEAVVTCPGSRDAKGKLVEVCQGCYATTGFYLMKVVKAPRQANREDWKRGTWVNEMIAAIYDQPFFRWFDSGDVYHPELAHKIFEVMMFTPNTKHWLPTRSHKVKKIKPWLTRMKRLPNVMVRYSSDRINQWNQRLHGSIVFDEHFFPTGGLHGTILERFQFHRTQLVTVCQAYTRGGKCGDCRACWDKTISVIGYPAHGKQMLNLIAKKTLDILSRTWDNRRRIRSC